MRATSSRTFPPLDGRWAAAQDRPPQSFNGLLLPDRTGRSCHWPGGNPVGSAYISRATLPGSPAAPALSLGHLPETCGTSGLCTKIEETDEPDNITTHAYSHTPAQPGTAPKAVPDGVLISVCPPSLYITGRWPAMLNKVKPWDNAGEGMLVGECPTRRTLLYISRACAAAFCVCLAKVSTFILRSCHAGAVQGLIQSHPDCA